MHCGSTVWLEHHRTSRFTICSSREREKRTRIGSARPFGGKGRASIWGEHKSEVQPTFYTVFDDSAAPDAEAFTALLRVSKKVVIWGGNFFLDHLGKATCMIVWDKGRRGLTQADCEIAWTNLKGQSRIFDFKWNGMLQEDMKNKEVRIHATQKPVALYKWLLNNYAKEGDLILDPYLGSGSSRIAAYDLGFDFVGYEINATIFAEQEERFKNHTAQTSLFV